MKKLKKILITIIIALIIPISILIFSSIKAYAYGINGPLPEIDGWKNGNDTSLNGTGVEYNGLRIGDTVWCKQNDTLGVTVWGKEHWFNNDVTPNIYDYTRTIDMSYLSLGGTDSFSKYYIYPDSNSGPGNNIARLKIQSGTADVIPVDQEIGHTTTSDNGYWHVGSLFWLNFNQNRRTYKPKANLHSLDGNWLAQESFGLSQDSDDYWKASSETIITDSDAPDINITPNSKTSDTSISVGLNVKDSGCGIQKYKYQIIGTGAQSGQDSNWISPTYHSNLDGSAFQSRVYNAPVQIPSSTDTMSTTAILSSPGTYQIKVTAMDNLGNTSTKTSGYYIINGTPTPPPISGTGGTITFVPNSTLWTNVGKIAGFPVQVVTTNQNPVETWTQHYTITATTTTVSAPDKDGKTTSSISTSSSETGVPFKVTYKLSNISLTGNESPSTLPNTGGNILIKEGANSVINATASYSISNKETPVAPSPSNTADTTYSVSKGAEEKAAGAIVDSPNIAGTSGAYNVDYTDPTLSIDNPSSLWVNKPVNVNINATDPLGKYNPTGQSGLSKAIWGKTDSSHYGKNSNNNSFLSSPGALTSSTTVTLNDGIYAMKADDLDSATNSGGTGNSNTLTHSTYYVDTTAPSNSFSVAEASPSRIFKGDGVTIAPSAKGTGTALYGTLTLTDNLSGVAKAEDSWTFGSADNGSYETIYTSPYTYNDRYQEVIKKQIEKPVGDNLYLHVKEWDTAGNETDTMYGPYEDPIKLKKFEVTDVHDPSWESVFYKDLALTQPTGRTFKANELPLDNTSNSVYKNADIKKGYAFNFDITSEYLYRDNDRIEVKPYFYYTDGKSRVPVDCYYNLNNNPFTLVGSPSDTLRLNLDTTKYGSVLIGGLSKMTLTRGVRIADGKEFYGTNGWQNKIQYSDGKTQWWYGKYYVPSNAVFVKHGDKPTPNNVLGKGHIIVNFQIIGYKNGIETLSQDQMYSYVDNNWVAEGGPKNANYQNGDVMVYNNAKSVLDDYTSHIIQ